MTGEGPQHPTQDRTWGSSAPPAGQAPYWPRGPGLSLDSKYVCMRARVRLNHSGCWFHSPMHSFIHPSILPSSHWSIHPKNPYWGIRCRSYYRSRIDTTPTLMKLLTYISGSQPRVPGDLLTHTETSVSGKIEYRYFPLFFCYVQLKTMNIIFKTNTRQL